MAIVSASSMERISTVWPALHSDAGQSIRMKALQWIIRREYSDLWAGHERYITSDNETLYLYIVKVSHISKVFKGQMMGRSIDGKEAQWVSKAFCQMHHNLRATY